MSYSILRKLWIQLSALLIIVMLLKASPLVAEEGICPDLQLLKVDITSHAEQIFKRYYKKLISIEQNKASNLEIYYVMLYSVEAYIPLMSYRLKLMYKYSNCKLIYNYLKNDLVDILYNSEIQLAFQSQYRELKQKQQHQLNNVLANLKGQDIDLYDKYNEYKSLIKYAVGDNLPNDKEINTMINILKTIIDNN